MPINSENYINGEKMDIESQKAIQFVNRLLSNPAIQNLYPLQKESQILQFLKLNTKQLIPTLSSQAFFPGKNWESIIKILYMALMNIINEELIKGTEKILNEIDYNFIAFLREQGLPVENPQKYILAFQKSMLTKPEARQAFTGPYTAVSLKITDQYIDEAFNRREYIYFELVKVQKLKMSKEEIKNLVKVSIILKNMIHIIPFNQNRSQNVSNVVHLSFAQKALEQLREKLKILPEPLLKSGINSNISFLENPEMETTSRLASVFAFRCQNYKSFQKIDRGADTPDKSWFNIARRNYKFYGFDIKMLDELYKTAAENGW
jgi:hypothetical protein